MRRRLRIDWERAMTFQDLLIYLDGWARCQVTMRVATLLAQRFNARLSGLHVLGLLLPTQLGINLTEARDALTSSHALGSLREASASAEECAEEIYRMQLQRAGLQGDWISREGMVAYTAGIEARRFDMTIVGQIDPQRPPLGTRGQVPEALFMESGRPVLVVPCAGEFDTIATRVLVAWDGSREAARAVHDAMPFLERAEFVRVATFERDSRFANDTLPDPMDIVGHLGRHGIVAQGLTRRLHRQSVAEALLACAAEEKADLLVMGGYGHSRLFEIITGGTTRNVLRHMNVPVLLSH